MYINDKGHFCHIYVRLKARQRDIMANHELIASVTSY